MPNTKNPCRHHDIHVFESLRYCLACGETIFDSSPAPDKTLRHRGYAPYNYRRLNYELGREIRLLILYPARDFEDELTCDIIHANLNDKLVYEALSYTWATEDGECSLTQHIICSRERANIAITRNCETALRHLRLRGRRRVLWVDAICIHQYAVSEKNHQIGLMGSIYANASQVIAFAGDSSPSTDRVLEYLATGVKPHHWNDRREELREVHNFLLRGYFRRAWILQEIALAKLVTLMIGAKTTRWTQEMVQNIQALVKNAEQAIPSALKWFPGDFLEENLLEALVKGRNTAASDPRDKVFALLGLVRKDAVQTYAADYSLTMDDVNIGVAKFLITEQKNMNALKYATGCFSGLYPSWVPDWQDPDSVTAPHPQFNKSDLMKLSETWFTSGRAWDQDRAQKYADGLMMLNLDVECPELDSQQPYSVKYICSTLEALSPSSDWTQAYIHELASYLLCKRYQNFQPTVVKTSNYILRVRAHYLDRASNSDLCKYAALHAHYQMVKLLLSKSAALRTLEDLQLPPAINSFLMCSQCRNQPARSQVAAQRENQELDLGASFEREPLKTEAYTLALKACERAIPQGHRFETTQSIGSAYYPP